ncbi:hemerythrin domain-containing protein [Negadavirga shengliensis]|uniref:Hemerythrin domain-containing protein n=1 Tax=Negadavirga shengliensis TaxID=1389218 RepID=A0ABV9SV81_9BACT
MSSSENIEKRSIADLVSENYILAGVLHYFGISFFEYEKNSLEEVCAKFKVNPSQVISELENWAIKKDPTSDELYLHPIEVLVGYLKKKHRFFVRQELPFLSSMVNGIVGVGSFESLLADMRLMFPLFVDDFIHHIHEEEATLFNRIVFLQDIEQHKVPLNDAIDVFKLSPVSNMATEHEGHDDEMEGIRKLTSNYQLPPNSPISVKILYHELQRFERELIIHAKIENELLFPKAEELEKEVKRKLLARIKSN